MASCQVRNPTLVPAPKSVPVRIPLLGRQMRVAILVAIVHVGPAMILNVLLCADDPIMKPLPLNLL